MFLLLLEVSGRATTNEGGGKRMYQRQLPFFQSEITKHLYHDGQTSSQKGSEGKWPQTRLTRDGGCFRGTSAVTLELRGAAP